MQSPYTLTESLAHQTRRHFLSRCGMGLGSMALASMAQSEDSNPLVGAGSNNALSSKLSHHVAKAKQVIYLFMAGGPSQLELLDYKPVLQQYNGKAIPDSYLEGKRFAFMDSSFKNRSTLLGTRRTFQQHGQCGMWVSDLLPHTAGIVDECTFLRSCQTNLFNHAPAKLFMNTGSGQFGRPSMGAWANYGLGTSCQDLPGFVVLQSGPRGPRGGAVNWGSGFLPTVYQGVPLRGQGEPILNLTTPDGIGTPSQRSVIDTVKALNMQHLVETGDPEIATRIEAYEMAFKMQASAPELIDLSQESRETLELYGVESNTSTFARNCLLARRLVERGVKFIQLYHTNWDSHGGPGENLQGDFEKVCREIDQPCAALVKDLKRRGLLDDTLVIWGGEFGRTPMGENRSTTGRNHHIDAFTMWFAGGGTKAGHIVGETDELGFDAISDSAHTHDIHATILHLLGLDHERLTFRFQGRDFRLTDVHGQLIHKLYA